MPSLSGGHPHFEVVFIFEDVSLFEVVYPSPGSHNPLPDMNLALDEDLALEYHYKTSYPS